MRHHIKNYLLTITAIFGISWFGYTNIKNKSNFILNIFPINAMFYILLNVLQTFLFFLHYAVIPFYMYDVKGIIRMSLTSKYNVNLIIIIIKVMKLCKYFLLSINLLIYVNKKIYLYEKIDQFDLNFIQIFPNFNVIIYNTNKLAISYAIKLYTSVFFYCLIFGLCDQMINTTFSSIIFSSITLTGLILLLQPAIINITFLVVDYKTISNRYNFINLLITKNEISNVKLLDFVNVLFGEIFSISEELLTTSSLYLLMTYLAITIEILAHIADGILIKNSNFFNYKLMIVLYVSKCFEVILPAIIGTKLNRIVSTFISLILSLKE